MNFDEAMTSEQFNQQKLNVEFSNALMIYSRGALTEKAVKGYIQILAEQMGPFISKEGYKPSEKAEIIIKEPGLSATRDPLNPFSSIAGKVNCDLTATKDQYIFYASEIISKLKEECKRQIEKTWDQRLEEYIDSKFEEKYPWLHLVCDTQDSKDAKKFFEKKNKFLNKIKKLVEKFEI